MDTVTIAHGSGGQESAEFIKKLILKSFNNPVLKDLEDAALLKNTPARIAFTTDSYIVEPVFFPGGNIGDLAVCGTVNDLSVKGAAPKYISVSFIIEEGFKINDFKKILTAVKTRAKEAGIIIAAGDTKVAPKSKVDKIFINTAGIGYMLPNADIAAKNIKPGDVIIVSGDLGAHSVAIMNARHNLGIKSNIKTDSAPLNKMTASLIKALGKDIKAMRDITRGGLSTVLNELASKNIGFDIEERVLPVSPAVKAAAALLGLDVLDMANEGKLVCAVSQKSAVKALNIIKKSPYGKNAKIIGKATKEGRVNIITALGVKRALRPPLGAVLPRIC
jgi:hydrogenase expression/formation protein HypE